MKIKILGTKWTIKCDSEENDPILEGADGYCDNSIKTIVIRKLEKSQDSLKDLESYSKKVLRHEIVHAFLHESGLSMNSNGSDSWATNEEMVDWIAIQGPKIYSAWKDANALEV
jgi:hypothetical protein